MSMMRLRLSKSHIMVMSLFHFFFLFHFFLDGEVGVGWRVLNGNALFACKILETLDGHMNNFESVPNINSFKSLNIHLKC